LARERSLTRAQTAHKTPDNQSAEADRVDEGGTHPDLLERDTALIY
jgi:hypothetical protein